MSCEKRYTCDWHGKFWNISNFEKHLKKHFQETISAKSVVESNNDLTKSQNIIQSLSNDQMSDLDNILYDEFED